MIKIVFLVSLVILIIIVLYYVYKLSKPQKVIVAPHKSEEEPVKLPETPLMRMVKLVNEAQEQIRQAYPEIRQAHPGIRQAQQKIPLSDIIEEENIHPTPHFQIEYMPEPGVVRQIILETQQILHPTAENGEFFQMHIGGNLVTFPTIQEIIDHFFSIIDPRQLLRDENSHDSNVVAGIRELTRKLIKIYDPNMPITYQVLEHIRRVRSEADYEKCQDALIMIDKTVSKETAKIIADMPIEPYENLTPRQIMSIIYQQAQKNARTPEEMDNVVDRIAIALIESYDEQVCATGMYNRIVTATELFGYDNIESMITTEEFVNEAIKSKLGLFREQVIAEERARGDPTGVINALDQGALTLNDVQNSQIEDMRNKLMSRGDMEFGNIPYYQKNRSIFAVNAF